METVKTESAKLTFATLAGLELDALTKHVKDAVRLFEKIETARKGERDERKQNAKYVAELRRRYAKGKDDGFIPSDVTFPKWAENIVKGKIPGRLQSLAALFNSLVLMNGADGKPLITEEIYDAAALDWLEKANAIVNAAQKADPQNWKSSQDVQECIKALSSPGDAAETLDKIRKRQKGVKDSAEETENVPLTAERAVEHLIAFMNAQLGVIEQKPEVADAQAMFRRLVKLNNSLSVLGEKQDALTDAFGAVYDKETLNSWHQLADAGVADHVQLVSSHPETAPADTVTAEKIGSLIPTEEEITTGETAVEETEAEPVAA